ELCGYIKTISQKMLTVTLKTLEADGLVKRTVYPQIPPKVEYELTPRGQSLMPHLHDLVAWASNNMTDIKKSREIYAAHAESLK
ncbi:MAG: helix-turn-helix domain-containing protein, partial [Bacteroidota bacterium]|nr:helix-turn-helix domain-containing protein [Bacteroidota bacterium]